MALAIIESSAWMDLMGWKMSSAKELDVDFFLPAKRFLSWLIDVIGQEGWRARRDSLVSDIRAVESGVLIDRLPVEPRLFVRPKEGVINWYMYLVDVLGVEVFSDDPFESHRIYPVFAAIGEQFDKLVKVEGIERVLERLVSLRENHPDNELFELLVAAHYLRNGYEVAFVKEDAGVKTPDMRVCRGGVEFFVECKRLGRITKYSEEENGAWNSIWSKLSLVALGYGVSHWLDFTFRVPLSSLDEDYVVEVCRAIYVEDKDFFEDESLVVKVVKVDVERLNRHFSLNRVRVNSPQIHELIFSGIDSNEKRSTAIVPTGISRPGSVDTVLNIFIDGVATCVGAQWRCIAPESLEKRSRHFKSVIGRASEQIPAGRIGVVHAFYETAEGADVEIRRREKLIEAFSGFTASGLIATFIHGVHVYPGVEGFEWAETVQHFTIDPSVPDVLFNHHLLLGFVGDKSTKDDTHWEQDLRLKSE